MLVLWSRLLGAVGWPWWVACCGWAAALYLWQRSRDVTEIVVHDGHAERLIEVHPARSSRVELYYESAQTGRVRLDAAARAQRETLQMLAPGAAHALAYSEPPRHVPAPVAAAADDPSPIPLPPNWPRRARCTFDPCADTAGSRGLGTDPTVGDGSNGDPHGLVLHAGPVSDLTVEHAARTPRRPAPVTLVTPRRLWHTVLLGAAGISLTAFAALWLLLPNRSPGDLLWFGVPLACSALVGWVVVRAVRRR